MNSNNGILVVLSGPSGCGKDTVLDNLKTKLSDMKLSVSMTTRMIRSNEIDGVHYFFTDFEDFEKKIGESYFIEYAKYGVNYYGTPKKHVDEMLSEGGTVFLKIDVQGAANIRRLYPDCVCIFLMAPSFEELKKRLQSRETENSEDYDRRVAIAKNEISRASEYDYVVINEYVDRAADDIIAIISAERSKYKYMKNYISEVMENA